MADEIDIANERAEMLRDMAINKKKPEPKLKAMGQCLTCGEHLEGTRRWCDADCRDEYEKFHKREI